MENEGVEIDTSMFTIYKVDVKNKYSLPQSFKYTSLLDEITKIDIENIYSKGGLFILVAFPNKVELEKVLEEKSQFFFEKMETMNDRLFKRGSENLRMALSEKDLKRETFLSSTSFDSTDTEIFNFLIIGHSSSGKTTFINNMKKFRGRRKKNLHISDTLVAEKNSVQMTIGKRIITFDILDTPGLFEMREKKDEIRTTEQLLQLAFDCVKENFTKLNAILVCHNMKDMISPEHLKVFEIFEQEISENMGPRMVLLLTHAENFTLEQRKNYVEKLMKSENFEVIRKLFGDRIIFTSGLDHELVSMYPQIRESIESKIDVDVLACVKFLCNFEGAVSPLNNLNYFIEQKKKQDEINEKLLRDKFFEMWTQKAQEEGIETTGGKIVFQKTPVPQQPRQSCNIF